MYIVQQIACYLLSFSASTTGAQLWSLSPPANVAEDPPALTPSDETLLVVSNAELFAVNCGTLPVVATAAVSYTHLTLPTNREV